MPLKRPAFLPYQSGLVQKARDLRRSPTPAEKKLWYGFLQPHPCRFLRQRPIDAFIVDFYCASRKLVIEIDGDSHFQNGAQQYDQTRTSVLEGYGLKVLRFTNPEVLNHFDQVCQQIQTALDARR